jgi:6-pyruvoyl-tetrahydropterin synthase|tara:strand:+ start:1385 stop:1783 length:399 start_codon:yes stop_codon:yes gene_type:complete
MFEVKVTKNMFIAHSLNDDLFGPAKNLHGATYIIDLIVAGNCLTQQNIVIDIDLASKLLEECISQYNYKNLDDIPEFQNTLTTTEFMAKKLTEDFINKLKKINFNTKDLYSIKMILNESHIASASYLTLLNE